MRRKMNMGKKRQRGGDESKSTPRSGGDDFFFPVIEMSDIRNGNEDGVRLLTEIIAANSFAIVSFDEKESECLALAYRDACRFFDNVSPKCKEKVSLRFSESSAGSSVVKGFTGYSKVRDVKELFRIRRGGDQVWPIFGAVGNDIGCLQHQPHNSIDRCVSGVDKQVIQQTSVCCKVHPSSLFARSGCAELLACPCRNVEHQYVLHEDGRGCLCEGCAVPVSTYSPVPQRPSSPQRDTPEEADEHCGANSAQQIIVHVPFQASLTVALQVLEDVVCSCVRQLLRPFGIDADGSGLFEECGEGAAVPDGRLSVSPFDVFHYNNQPAITSAVSSRRRKRARSAIQENSCDSGEQLGSEQKGTQASSIAVEVGGGGEAEQDESDVASGNCSAHVDPGLMTLIPAAAVPGLEVLLPPQGAFCNGWLAVEELCAAIQRQRESRQGGGGRWPRLGIVLSGDYLQSLSGGRLPGAVHRVRKHRVERVVGDHGPSGQPRVSLVYELRPPLACRSSQLLTTDQQGGGDDVDDDTANI